MAMISKRVMEEIRFRNDIAEVIGTYFHLQRAGANYKALCPFHKEKTPSFHVNAQRQIYHCFGCGAGGDVFRFIMQQEGVDFVGAARLLAHRAGMTVEFDESEESGSDKTALYAVHAAVADLFHKTLLEDPGAAAARQYVKKRDLSDETVAQFRIGYAPNRWDTLLAWGRKNSYTTAQLEMAGLILKKADAANDESAFYDRFRNRLMFPIFDEQTRVIGFSGRTLEEDAKTAKYVNSPETPLFKKSRVLYALDKARRPIVDAREAIICEGQIDVIRCHQAGFSTAVAAQGTAFTEEHVRIVRRYADSVCLVFDGDKAGQDAAMRAAIPFLDAGLAVRAVALPAGEDPDSFIRKKGPEAFGQLLEKGESAVAFQIRVLASRENAKTEVGIMRIARAVLQTIVHSPNAVQRAALVQEAAQRLNLPASALQDDLRHRMRQSQAGGGEESRSMEHATGPRPAQAHPPEETMLCEHMAHVIDHPEIGDCVRTYLPLPLISDPVCRSIVAACLASAETGRNLQDVLRDDEAATDELHRLAAEIQDAPLKVPGQEFSRLDAVRDLVLRLWRRKFETERAELSAQGAGVDRKAQERRQQLTSHLHHLKRWEDGEGILLMEMTEV